MAAIAAFALPDITPFATFSLLELKGLALDLDRAEAAVAALAKSGAFALDEILEISTTDPEAGRYRPPGVAQLPDGGDRGPWAVWYVERRRPGWLRNVPENLVVDSVNHLAIVLAHRGYLGVYASDGGARNQVERWLIEWDEGRAVQRVPARALHDAFANNPAVTLWLRGLHRPTDLKPSRKTLFGSRLRRALNPLDDQTYQYSAARCRARPNLAIGISPSRAKVWLRSVRGLDELVNMFGWVADEIIDASSVAPGEVVSEDNLLDVLAQPVEDVSPLSGPSELALYPPDVSEDTDDADEQARELRESHARWSEHGSFVVEEPDEAASSPSDDGASEPHFSVLARLENEDVARFAVKVVANAAGVVRLDVEETGVPGDKADADAAARLLQNSDAVVVWFDSGHTLSGGQVFETRHRDLRFRYWKWADLRDEIIIKEKPEKPNARGTNVFAPELVGVGPMTSLFDWVAAGGQPDILDTTHGWLLCDDGALEVSDFVHLDTAGAVPRLTLIHVKAAVSNSPARKISVTDYELVSAQSGKNLRWLNPQHLADRLAGGNKGATAGLIWKDGKLPGAVQAPALREEFLNVLRGLRMLERRVVVLQPSLRNDRYSEGMKEFETADLGHPSDRLIRLFHLDHLFLGLEGACHAYGADLLVIGQNPPSVSSPVPDRASARKRGTRTPAAAVPAAKNGKRGRGSGRRNPKSS
jgi:hypothetical protein